MLSNWKKNALTVFSDDLIHSVDIEVNFRQFIFVILVTL